MMSNPLTDFGSGAACGEMEGATGGIAEEPSGTDFPRLKSLNIGLTPIKSWETLDKLRQFPRLVDVRLNGIAFAEVIGNVMKFCTDTDLFYNLVGGVV